MGGMHTVPWHDELAEIRSFWKKIPYVGQKTFEWRYMLCYKIETDFYYPVVY
jgi:hypothetical protein